MWQIIRRTGGTAWQVAESYTAPVGQTPREKIWQLNKTALYRYTSPHSAPRRAPLLLVYALINKPYIFDLLPGQSFVETMLVRGYDVYLLDWGAPGPEDSYLSFDDYALEYLPRAVRRVLRASGSAICICSATASVARWQRCIPRFMPTRRCGR